MKRLGIGAALAVAVAAIWYLQRPHTTLAAPDAPVPARAPVEAAGGSPGAPRTRPVTRVTKLASAEERRQLAQRITSAQASRATHAAPMPRLPDAEDDSATPISKTEIRAAMQEVIPHVIECYETAIPTLASPDLSVVAELTLTGDPDVGTIVDAKQLADKAGTPLPAAFDDCLRSTLQVMALPPLAEGDHVEVRYPFEFRRN